MDRTRIASWLIVAALLGSLAALVVPQGWSLPVLAPAKPPVVVVVHRSEVSLPAYAMGAVNELRAAGRTVFVVDDDPKNGLGGVPKAVAPAVEKARDLGHPALVLLDGERVVGAIKLPASKEAILEAAQ